MRTAVKSLLGERDFTAPDDPLPDALMERRKSYRYSYDATMGVERSDPKGRAAIARKNFGLFDAPHAAFFPCHGRLAPPVLSI